MPLPTRRTHRIQAHQGACHTLTYSTGGAYLLTGGSDRTINLLNPHKGTQIQSYTKGHSYEILSLSVSANNAKFVSAGGGRLVCLWDVSTATVIRRFEAGSVAGAGVRVNTVRLCGDGEEESLLCTGGSDCTVRFWDLRASGYKSIMEMKDARDGIGGVDIKDAVVLAGSTDGRVRAYDLRMGLLTTDVVGPPVTGVHFTIDMGAYLATTLDSSARLMDRATGGMLARYKGGHRNDEFRIQGCLSPGDKHVIVGSEDGWVVGYDFVEGREVMRVKGCEGGRKSVVDAVKMHPRGKQMAAAGVDGVVMVFEE